MSEYKQAPLGLLCEFQAGGTPTSTNAVYWSERNAEGIPWVSIADMSGTDLVTNTAKCLTEEGLKALGMPKYPAGTVLFAMYASVGKVSTLGIPAVWNQALLGLKPRDNRLESKFLAYALKTLAPLLPLYYRSTTQHNLSAQIVEKLRIPFPSVEIQQRIVDYLDRETAEIDAAVADLDRYSELLAKRRLLVVDEELSRHQTTESNKQLTPLKLIIETRFSGDWGSEPRSDEIDARCVRVADFDRATNTVNDEVPTVRSYSSEIYASKRLRYHDILVERSGGGEKTPVGSAMLYTGGNEALCANFIEVVRLKDDQVPEYWAHILRREYAGRNTMRFVKQTTGIQNLDPQGFYDQKFHVPRKADQQHLARVLRQRTSAIDNLIAESTKLRDLLLKRRSVLITEVVTGRKQV